MDRHYLDHASTSPLRPAAREAMVEWLTTSHGDPSRVHEEGMLTRGTIEQAREKVAGLLGARSREVVFTSGGTEAIATAVWGAAGRGTHMVVPAIEHSAVRVAVAAYTGVEPSIVGVNDTGRVDPDEVMAAVTRSTVLVNIQWGNHEVGTLQPVTDVVAACRERGVLVHVDAAQAIGHVPIDFKALGADLMSVSAHKFGGPPGIGALLVRRGLRLRELIVGGDQERARRAGFENIPAIVGFGAACDDLDPDALGREAAEAMRLTGQVIDMADQMEEIHVYGDRINRLPHIVCLGIEGIEPQAVLLGLDRAGIAAHSGSACSSEALEPSPVLLAMGLDARRSLRISVGWNNTQADIDALVGALPEVIGSLRSLG